MLALWWGGVATFSPKMARLTLGVKHGDCHVPQCYTDNQILGQWVMQTVRIEKRSLSLTEMQEQSLAALGIAWNLGILKKLMRVRVSRWFLRYVQLCFTFFIP
jgi:hypothetical protein